MHVMGSLEKTGVTVDFMTFQNLEVHTKETVLAYALTLA